MVDSTLINDIELIKIMDFCSDSYGYSTLKSLSLSNIIVTKHLMQHVFCELMPNLYTLELSNLKTASGLNLHEIFKFMLDGSELIPQKSFFYRLKL